MYNSNISDNPFRLSSPTTVTSKNIQSACQSIFESRNYWNKCYNLLTEEHLMRTKDREILSATSLF